MMINSVLDSTQKSSPHFRSTKVTQGFTLVELLIVMAIFSVLVAVALPMVRTLVSEQKGANTSRAISAYIDAARRRAFTEGRSVGVLIERLDSSSRATVEPGQSAALRIRQLIGVPVYSGEASDALAVLVGSTATTSGGRDMSTIPGVDTAEFNLNDNQLLNLSFEVSSDGNPANDGVAPIKTGDLLELPGGRRVPILEIDRDVSQISGLIVVKVHFDLRETVQPNGFSSLRFPASGRAFSVGQQVKYKIHRRPVISTSAPYDLPRGMVIDLNYSGFGSRGSDFAPIANDTNASVAIVFGPDGRVVSVRTRSGDVVSPIGLIYLCLGTADGVRPDDLFSTEKGGVANILDPESIWIVINPNTGRVVSSPMTSVNLVTTTPVLADVLDDAREFARLGDTVDSK